MANLRIGIVLQAVDRATAPLRGLAGSAGGTRKALAGLEDQASRIGGLRGLRTELGGLRGKLGDSRRETTRLALEMKRAETPSRKLAEAWGRSRRKTIELGRAYRSQKSELRELSAGLRKAGIDTQRLDAEQGRLERTSARLQRRLDRLGRTDSAPRRGGGFLSGVAGGLLATGAFAGAAGSLRSLSGFVETAAKFETIESTLRTLEGSAGKAEASMEWISDFTTRTPFELDQVAEAFVRLRAYGMDPTDGLMRSLGDTASAMGKDVMQAVEAIADAVTGENERLKEFGIQARKVKDRFVYEFGAGETATAAADDRAEIRRVLTGIMDRQYAGAMKRQMGTFAGMMSNLRGHWTEFQLQVMEAGPFAALKGRLRDVLGRIDAMGRSGELDELADRFGQSLVTAFDTFEKDLWPVLRDDVGRC